MKLLTFLILICNRLFLNTNLNLTVIFVVVVSVGIVKLPVRVEMGTGMVNNCD